MQHLHEELSKRRDKRLELARLRRDYEVVNVTKRRKLDEDSVWSWWKVRTRSTSIVRDVRGAYTDCLSLDLQLKRDELQTQMIAEMHRKRRYLDRERRAMERSQPRTSIASYSRRTSSFICRLQLDVFPVRLATSVPLRPCEISSRLHRMTLPSHGDVQPHLQALPILS